MRDTNSGRLFLVTRHHIRPQRHTDHIIRPSQLRWQYCQFSLDHDALSAAAFNARHLTVFNGGGVQIQEYDFSEPNKQDR